MKKTILTFGLISGAIVAAMMFLTVPLHRNGTLGSEYGVWIGYTTMVIALSLIFFGVRSYRDQQNQPLTFGRGLAIGLLITLIASICYAVAWEVNFHFFLPDFVDQMRTASLDKARAANATAAELDKIGAQMDDFAKMYANPVIRFAITLAEILPVGILISLLSAALLRRKVAAAA